MLEVVEPDWEIINQFKDDDHEVIIEGVYEFRDSINAKFYQVVYKTPWRTLIKPTGRMPSTSEIHSALSLITDSPKYVRANIKLMLLTGLFLRLDSMGREKGFCIVCGKNSAGSSPSHDGNCILNKALVIIQKQTPNV